MLTGALTLETAPWLWKQLEAGGLLQGERRASLAEVTESDSAGLAMLLAWRAACRAAGGDLVIADVPARLIALARLTNAETALESPASASG